MDQQRAGGSEGHLAERPGQVEVEGGLLDEENGVDQEASDAEGLDALAEVHAEAARLQTHVVVGIVWR